MENCILCKLIKGDLPNYKIYEDDKFFACLDINPVNPGHTLLFPKKHIDYFYNLDDSLLSELFLKAKELAEPIRKSFKPERVGLIIEGFVANHCHLHLIPLYNSGELDFKRAKRAKSSELAEWQEKILNEMKE